MDLNSWIVYFPLCAKITCRLTMHFNNYGNCDCYMYSTLYRARNLEFFVEEFSLLPFLYIIKNCNAWRTAKFTDWSGYNVPYKYVKLPERWKRNFRLTSHLIAIVVTLNYILLHFRVVTWILIKMSDVFSPPDRVSVESHCKEGPQLKKKLN